MWQSQPAVMHSWYRVAWSVKPPALRCSAASTATAASAAAACADATVRAPSTLTGSNRRHDAYSTLCAWAWAPHAHAMHVHMHMPGGVEVDAREEHVAAPRVTRTLVGVATASM